MNPLRSKLLDFRKGVEGKEWQEIWSKFSVVSPLPGFAPENY